MKPGETSESAQLRVNQEYFKCVLELNPDELSALRTDIVESIGIIIKNYPGEIDENNWKSSRALYFDTANINGASRSVYVVARCKEAQESGADTLAAFDFYVEMPSSSRIPLVGLVDTESYIVRGTKFYTEDVQVVTKGEVLTDQEAFDKKESLKKLTETLQRIGEKHIDW